VHVVLFRVHPKVFKPAGNGIVSVDDVDRIIDDAARMRHPLAAYHKMIACIVAKRVRLSAVPPAKSHPAGNGVEQPLFLFSRDRTHGYGLDDQIVLGHTILIQIGVECIALCNFVPFFFEKGNKDILGLFGFVTGPSAPDKQCFFHDRFLLYASGMWSPPYGYTATVAGMVRPFSSRLRASSHVLTKYM